ncbi:hypothetical protein [Ktedonospora formicarum]|uniref:Lipoprotein n=1 Tax=Ktedonospora formicarum TaxID=2778364 RepID=A0A8J3MY58_9CHLR|nr:hypothetical protein [Ktedonospora formicarum]GHO49310.1 hypothetical protein KSX_74730 [Ktedonospora formicarum]
MSKRAFSFQKVLTLTFLLSLVLLVSACRIMTREEAERIQQSKNAKASLSDAAPAYPASNPKLPVKTTHLTLEGKKSIVLTDARGFVLYYYVPDTLAKPACTGACLTAWPPLIANTDHVSFCHDKLPGEFALHRLAEGKQVTYNGHLLYTYINDRQPGQVTGNNLYQWFAVTTELK